MEQAYDPTGPGGPAQQVGGDPVPALRAERDALAAQVLALREALRPLIERNIVGVFDSSGRHLWEWIGVDSKSHDAARITLDNTEAAGAALLAREREKAIREVSDFLKQNQVTLARFARGEWNAVQLCEFVVRSMASGSRTTLAEPAAIRAGSEP